VASQELLSTSKKEKKGEKRLFHSLFRTAVLSFPNYLQIAQADDTSANAEWLKKNDKLAVTLLPLSAASFETKGERGGKNKTRKPARAYLVTFWQAIITCMANREI